MTASLRAGVASDGFLQVDGVDAIKFDANGIERIAFRAHANGTTQSVPSNAWTPVNFGLEIFDLGARYASNAWTPPAGRPVMLMAGVTFETTAAGQLVLSAVYKNGAVFAQGSGMFGGAAGKATSAVSCMDLPNGTDVYTIRAFHLIGASANATGFGHEVYFEGVRL